MKQLIKSILAIVLLFQCTGAFAQEAQNKQSKGNDFFLKWKKTPSGKVRCYTDEREIKLRKSNPGLQTRQQFENWMKVQVKESREKSAKSRTTPIVYRIPIIFHIVHSGEAVGTATNISAAQVNAQITQLNNDYGKILGTSGYNSHPDGADVQIQFCAATLDPSNNVLTEPGIHRVSYSSMGFTAPPYDDVYIDATVKPALSWDPTKYLNIWVCDIQNDILGFAQFPDAPNLPGAQYYVPQNPATDGVALIYYCVGSSTQKAPGGAPYDEGRSATHEIGHWLGLRHIWGDGDCTVDDYVFDTPRAVDANYDCDATYNTCNDLTYGAATDADDMTSNYMDYTTDDCMNIFTKGQKERMRIIMGETGIGSPRRASLLYSDRCSTVPLVYFEKTDSTVIEGTHCTTKKTVALKVKITRAPASAVTINLNSAGTATNGDDYSFSPASVTFGPSDITDKTVTVTINGDAVSEVNETVQLSLSYSGSAVVVSNASHELTIQDDDFAPAQGKSQTTTIWSEGFEGTTTSWSTISFINGINRWLLGGTSTPLSGTKSAYISSSTSTASAQSYNATSLSSTVLFRQVSAVGYDSIKVSFIYKCNGEWDADGFWDFGEFVYSLNGKDFHQVPGSKMFYGTTTATTYSVTLPAFLYNTSFYIGFWWENDDNTRGNPPLVVDDIVVSGIQRIASPVQTTVNTGAGFDEQVVGPNQTVHFYNRSNGQIMATIENKTAWNYGCTRVEVDRAGSSGQFISGDPGTDAKTKVFDKTFKVTPTNANSSGNYKITLYVTAAEKTGWETASTSTLAATKLFNFAGPVSTMTTGSTIVKQPVTVAALGSDFAVSADLTGGFIGFGIGDPNAVSTGIPGLNDEVTGIAVMPNPFKDGFVVNISASVTRKAEIVVTNAVGQQIVAEQVQLRAGTNNQQVIQLKNQPAGIYMLRINYGTHFKTIRLLKHQ